MKSSDLIGVAEKLRKLSWLEAVNTTFYPVGTKTCKDLQAELEETRRLEILVREAAKCSTS